MNGIKSLLSRLSFCVFGFSLFAVLSASCGRLENELDSSHLDCGDAGFDHGSFFIVHDENGKRLPREDLKVFLLASNGAEPEPYPWISRQGCIKKQNQGTLFVRNLSGNAGALKSAEALENAETIELNDLRGQNLQPRCSSETPLLVTADFYSADLLEKPLSPDWENGFAISYQLKTSTGKVLAEAPLSLRDGGTPWFPFRSGYDDGLYKLEFTIKDIFRTGLARISSCLVKLDNTPPKVELAMVGNVGAGGVELHHTAGIILVKEGTILKFRQLQDTDLNEVQYCAEKLNDAFEDAAPTESDQRLRKEWEEKFASANCTAPWQSAGLEEPLGFYERHEGIWAIKFKAVDQLGNSSQVVHANPLLFYNEQMIKLIKSTAETVSPLLKAGDKLQAMSHAMQAFYLRRNLPTQYEKNLVTREVFKSLLTTAEQSSPFRLAEYEKLLPVHIAMAADGSTLARVTEMGFVDVYDARTTKLKTKFRTDGFADPVAISENGQLLAIDAGANATRLKIGNIETGKSLVELNLPQKDCLSLAISARLRRLAASFDDGSLMVWDSESGDLLKEFQASDTRINHLAFHPDRDFLIGGSNDGLIKIWNASSWQPHGSIASIPGKLRSFAPLPGNALAFIGSDKSSINILNIETNIIDKSWKDDVHSIQALAASADGKQVFTYTPVDSLKIWEPGSGRILKKIERTLSTPSLEVNYDGSLVFIVSGAISQDILSVKELDHIVPLAQPESDLESSVISEDGRLVAANNTQGLLKIWHSETGSLESTIQDDTCATRPLLVFSADNQFIVKTCDLKVKVWRIADGKLLQVFDHPVTHNVSGVVMTHDGKFVVSGSRSGLLTVFDLDKGLMVRSIKAHEGEVMNLDLSRNNEFLLSSSADLTTKVWKLTDLSLKSVFRHQYQVPVNSSFSSDNARILSIEKDNSKKIWNSETGALLKQIEGDGIGGVGYARHPSTFFQNDNFFLAQGHANLDAWDANTGEMFGILDSVKRPLAWRLNANGKDLVVLDSDHKLHFLDISMDGLVTRICAMAGSLLANQPAEGAGYMCPAEAIR